MSDFLNFLQDKCTKNHRNCLKPTNQRSIELTEGESIKLTIINDIQVAVHKIHLDGCLIPQRDTSQKRCDWVLYIDNPKSLLLIELKGKNSHNVDEQFESSKIFIGVDDTTYRYVYILVCRLNTRGTNYQRYKRKYGDNFHWIAVGVTKRLSEFIA